MQKIKIAQIGTGHDHAPLVFDALRRLPEVFDVVGFAQVPEDGGAIDAKYYAGAREYDVADILAMPDLDAIAVETFDLYLARYALLAAEKGVHVHMDKACGEDIEVYERMLSTVKQKGTVFHTGYMYRVNPAVKSVFARARSGDFGKIFAVDAEMSCKHAFPKRQWLGKLQGGMMQYLGCHMVDLVVRLLGVPEEIVPYNYCTGIDGVTATDAAFAVFCYPQALATVKSCITDEGGFVRRSFTVHGEKGTAEIRPMEINIVYPSHIAARTTEYADIDGWNGAGRISDSETFDRYADMMKDFAETVTGKRKQEVSFETEAQVARCLLTACGIPCDFKKSIVL